MLVKKGKIKVGKRKEDLKKNREVVQDGGTGRPYSLYQGHTKSTDTYGTTVSEKDLRTS